MKLLCNSILTNKEQVPEFIYRIVVSPLSPFVSSNLEIVKSSLTLVRKIGDT